MKAKDYYERDKGIPFPEDGDINTEAIKTWMGHLVQEFVKDTTDILEKRRGKSQEAFESVIKEQNQKWNALVSIFEKKHGYSPIRKDGYARFFEMLMREESVSNTSENGSNGEKETSTDGGTNS